jgi:hypothetical protein
MNAEMLPPVRSESVQAQIQKIRRFSKYARSGCAVFRVLLVILTVLILANLLVPGYSGLKLDFGVYSFNGTNFTLELQAWTFLVLAIPVGLTFKFVSLLYKLFSNLAAGAIHTPGNVHQLRQIGLLALWMAVHATVVPGLSLWLLEVGFIDATSVTQTWVTGETVRVDNFVLDGWFTYLLGAGLMLLASWIMDVGRQTSDEAERLRRDAELVV